MIDGALDFCMRLFVLVRLIDGTLNVYMPLDILLS